MDFLKRFLINLLCIGVLFLIVYLVSPGIMTLVYQTLGALFGPLLILIIVGAALPVRRKKSYARKTKVEKGNIAGESTHKLADKRYLKMIIIWVIGIGILALIGVMINNPKSLGIGGTGILILLILLKIIPDVFVKIVDRKDKEVNRARKGAESEIIVGDTLNVLSDQYFIIHDVVSKYGNIDHVIIKQNAGVLMIETKSHHGKVSLQNNKLLINEQFPEKDFIAQTISNALWLRDKISQIIGSNVWIFPVIVFTKAYVPLGMTVRGIHVVNIKFLTSTLEKINNNNPLNQQIWESREEIMNQLKVN